MRCSRSCAQAQCCVCCLLAAAESQAEAETSQSYFMPFIIFFSLLRRCSHSALICSRQERLRQLPEQVFLSLCAGCVAAGDKDVCSPLLPQAPGKKLGEGRWAVNDLSLGMGITQVVTGRGEAPQPPSAARNQLGQHRAVDFQALW